MDKFDDIRKKMIQLALETGHSHIAPALSCIDIIYTLYDDILKSEDRFILSKGHACLALYTVLLEKGLNPDTSCGHPDIDVKNGIECTTGSLGHGLPVAVGMAFAKKLKKENGNIYVLTSDGEFEEGTSGESLLLASNYKLDNLVVIIDRNKLQAIDFVDNVLPLGNLKQKFEAFDWNVYEIDGHNVLHIGITLMKISKNNKPSIIIANTVKGKGISFMENKPEWHAKLLNKEEMNVAIRELENDN